jgi:hypothetical protein
MCAIAVLIHWLKMDAEKTRVRRLEAEHWRHSSLMSLSLIFESDRGV